MTQEIEKIWPEWKVVERIGSGAYGSVYKAVRSDHNLTSSAAIKVISIPKDASEMESLRSDGMTQDGTRTYLQGIVDDFVNEIQLMETLKGIQNIVSVEDYKVVERTGEIGWDIYIRMELLTPFNDWKAPAPSRRPRSSVWASTSARRWRSARKSRSSTATSSPRTSSSTSSASSSWAISASRASCPAPGAASPSRAPITTWPRKWPAAPTTTAGWTSTRWASCCTAC